MIQTIIGLALRGPEVRPGMFEVCEKCETGTVLGSAFENAKVAQVVTKIA